MSFQLPVTFTDEAHFKLLTQSLRSAALCEYLYGTQVEYIEELVMALDQAKAQHDTGYIVTCGGLIERPATRSNVPYDQMADVDPKADQKTVRSPSVNVYERVTKQRAAFTRDSDA